MINDRDRNNAATKAADILKRVKDAQKTAEETLRVTQEAANQISYVGRVFRGIGNGIGWANDKVVEPVLGVIPFTKPLWQATLRQYAWFCHPSEPFGKSVWRGVRNYTGAGVNSVANLFRSEKKDYSYDHMPLGEFSKSRAGIAVLVTAIAASPIAEKIPFAGEFVPDIVSDHAAALIYEPPFDAARMGLTTLFNGGHLDKETIYLNGKNEIDPKGDVWSVGGCETKPGCSPEDAVSFRIKPSLMHQAWSFSTGRGPFLADYVAVPVPNVPSKCEVTSYGLRWRISKWLNSYPVLLEAKCEAQEPVIPSPLASPALQLH
jgi:hypothetical protein